MQASRFDTWTLPGVTDREAVRIATATEKPIRVVMRNRGGGGVIFVGQSTSDVQGALGSGSGVWEIAVGDSDVLILQPREVLYAASATSNGRLSVSISEALPLI